MKTIYLILALTLCLGTTKPPNRVESITTISDTEGMPAVYLVRLSSLEEDFWEGYRSPGVLDVKVGLGNYIAIVSPLDRDDLEGVLNSRLR